ncbi:MAG: substrate-binding domain-containing protein [Nakamurella sp.]
MTRYGPSHRFGAGAVLLAGALVLAACSSSAGTSGTSGAGGTAAGAAAGAGSSASAGPGSSSGSGSGSTAVSAAAGSSGAAAGSAGVDTQMASVQKMEGVQTEWTGPTTGPKAAANKTLVYMSGDQQNSLAKAYGDYLVAAAKTIGWKVTVIDGKGSPTGWLAGMNQAVGLHPDGIAIFADAASLQVPIKAATAAKIPVVGLHAAAKPGPTNGLFTNIQESAANIGKAQADFAIADSHGAARVVVVYHGEYQIAQIKADAMKAEIATCPGCKLLEFSNFPASESAQRTPQLMTSWVSKYGSQPFYVLSVGDNDFDFAVPALSAGGVPKNTVKLVGSDGTPAAYQRIRNGNYEVATVPEPSEMEAYQAVDEFNRAFAGQKDSGFVPPVYLVTKSNIDAEGGAKNLFIPSNNYVQHYESIWKTGKG